MTTLGKNYICKPCKIIPIDSPIDNVKNKNSTKDSNIKDNSKCENNQAGG